MSNDGTTPAPTLVQSQFRLPRSLLDGLDAWLAELNQGRDWPLLTRTDLVRGVLAWAVATRPTWEAPKVAK